MFNKKLKILSLTLVLLLLLVPATLAQDIDLEEYDLEYLSEEEIEALKTVLENLQEAEVIDEDQLTAIIEDLAMDEDEEDTAEDNFGERLATSIEDFKNENNEEWTGKELANNIQSFIINNREDIMPEEAQNKIKEANENKEEAQQNKSGEMGAQGNNDNAEDKGNGGY
jgi:hypothetical protein